MLFDEYGTPLFESFRICHVGVYVPAGTRSYFKVTGVELSHYNLKNFKNVSGFVPSIDIGLHCPICLFLLGHFKATGLNGEFYFGGGRLWAENRFRY